MNAKMIIGICLVVFIVVGAYRSSPEEQKVMDKGGTCQKVPPDSIRRKDYG